MENQTSNNKRIAKNALFLYARMLLLMLVNLYSSRVVLNALGVEDYGIYNVVGGVVTMFSVLSGSLTSAITRFLTFELGQKNNDIKKIFSTSINVQIVLIIIISLLLETVGLWFLNNKMVIPAERLKAANWVFQFSVITFAVSLWSVPYNALIIAHERMSAFAYISIFEAISKLAVAFIILYNPIDRLVYYGLLLLLISVAQRGLYTLYCRRHFDESKYIFIIDKKIIKDIFGFAGWNFIGASSCVLRDQGNGMVLNLFHGPVVNAAHGVAMSVNTAVTGFVSNLMTAINPQITKNYAVGDLKYVFRLVFQGARFSYYILYIIALPILLTTPYLLKLWLGIVPEHAESFTCLILIFSLCESLSHPLTTLVLATGDIKNYQIIVGGLQSLCLPLSLLALYLGVLPEGVFVITIVISIICFISRLVFLKRMVNLPIGSFIKQVLLNVLTVTIISAVIAYSFSLLLSPDSFLNFVLVAGFSVLSALIVIYTTGCSSYERQIVRTYLSKFCKRT